jgi:hypothetical protein
MISALLELDETVRSASRSGLGQEQIWGIDEVDVTFTTGGRGRVRVRI